MFRKEPEVAVAVAAMFLAQQPRITGGDSTYCTNIQMNTQSMIKNHNNSSNSSFCDKSMLASLSIFDSFYQTTEETTENRS